MSKAQPSASARSNARLSRYTACLPCRKHKLRCDAAKPVCGTCVKISAHASCKYDVAPPKSKTKALQEKIKELECAVEKVLIETRTAAREPNRHTYHVPTEIRALGPSKDPHGLIALLYGGNTAETRELFVEGKDLPRCVRNHLLEIFHPHWPQCAIDLYLPRFLNSLDLPYGQGPHPALLNVMYLLACHFSPSLSRHEPVFLRRVQEALSRSLQEGDRLSDFVLTSSLLSRYFAAKARMLEAHLMASTAMRFAMACGLHQISSRVWEPAEATGLIVSIPSGTLSLVPSTSMDAHTWLLPPPRDTIELGERINIFWCAFVVDRAVCIGGRLPFSIRDEEISTVWPMPIEQFVTVYALDMYLEEDPFSNWQENPDGMRLKGLALLSRASSSLDGLESDDERNDAFDMVDRAITKYAGSLPPVPPLAANRGARDETVHNPFDSSTAFIYTVAYAATIALHRARADTHPGSRLACLLAAGKAVEVIRWLDGVELNSYHAFMGIMWSDLARYLAYEHERRTAALDEDGAAMLKNDLENVQRIRRRFSETFPVFTPGGVKQSTNRGQILSAFSSQY
ncbi:hypothetical protein BOTBODRAFT_171495 [Botryobasidium botryosum FD-172 SS1]|uniref:Zn(2)-C6 fungal-type domain-containing protein n=1 Tax=Botryobasidium botryosum (strain FD-172 SS1) TaxID=930990 RepID=A0A067N4L3_BOTB1|nr:hypothetical protein BOTBODRAFT_171495 [Botryobasidium botryosum FD-172 SS1]